MQALRVLLPVCSALLADSAVAAAQAVRGPSLRGIVYDSVEMRPLAGAVVQLVALPIRSAPVLVTADSVGAFVIDSLSLGSYLLGFSHPRLDSLGLEPPLARIDVRTAASVDVTLGVPSAATMVRSVCKTDIAKDSTGILRGFARSAVDGFPVPRAKVRVEWPEFVLGRQGMRAVTRSIDAEANDAGRFLICGVPLGTTVLTRVYAGADSSGVLELGMPESGLLRRDLLLGDASHAVDMFERTAAADTGRSTDTLAAGARAVATAPAPEGAAAGAPTRRPHALRGDSIAGDTPTPDTSVRDTSVRDAHAATPTSSAHAHDVTAPTARRSGASIRGVVSTTEGDAIEGAAVRLFGSVGETTTRTDGTFVLGGVASGTQMLEVRALGYVPVKLAVDVMGSGETSAEIVLREALPILAEGTTLLDTMRVRSAADRLAASAMSVRRAFETRRQSGVGVFLTDSIIRSKNVQLPSELFRGMSGLTVTSGSGGQGVYMRASATFNNSKGLCLPTVFLDAARAPRAPVDQMAIIADLRAIEVYPRSQLAPPQFQTSDGCGVIVLWTRTMWEARNLPTRRP